ncbi:MAG TPA: prepilin-type N-terminal cleavage/methylation domain-containing protein [Candidatus Omnitrophota bacterium]|nr:prepilin-type N-terminal cleavage/methylation domain-containing protein [Candidatus Omnitrophota bacterium]
MVLISRRRYGFTLLELLFVVVISAILVSAAVPKLKNSISSLALQNFLSDISAFSKYAQMKAINSGSWSRVRFDRPKRTMFLENRFVAKDSLGAQSEQWRVERTRRIPGKVSIDFVESEDNVVFYPDGTSSEISLRIKGNDLSEFSVVAEVSCGRVIVEQEP